MKFMEKFGFRQDGVNRKFYGSISTNQVLDDDFSSVGIEAESSYFQIRLTEMLLRDQSEFLKNYIPLAIAVCKFNYNGKTREVPFLVGNQLLDSIGSYVQDEHVAYRNIRLVGPIPYTGDDVSLFIGLFRVQVSDLLKEFFGLMEKIVGAFDLSQLSSYLPIAEMVSDGLASLMGQKQVEMRLGTMDTFSGSGSGVNRFKSGYLAYVNCPENVMDAKQLWVEKGILMTGKDSDSLENFVSNDYCLVSVEALKERSDLDSLPFHQQWIEAKRHIWNGNAEGAEQNYLSLMRELAVSPDLTLNHRSALIQVYLANYQQEKALYNQVVKGIQGGRADGTRSATRGGAKSARGVVEKVASLSKKKELKLTDKDAVNKSIKQISANWNRIPHLETRTRDDELTGNILKEQIHALSEVQSDAPADPEALVRAITFASFHK